MTFPHFYIFFYYLHCDEDLTFYISKLYLFLSKFNLYQVWLKFDLLVLEKKIFEQISVFLLFRYYLPWRRGFLLPLNKPESLLPKDDLCQVWLKLAEWFWRRSRKCKSLQTGTRTDGQTHGSTDDGRLEKLTWARVSPPKTRNFTRLIAVLFFFFLVYYTITECNNLAIYSVGSILERLICRIPPICSTCGIYM
jgi:hypothetical protein